MDRTTTARPDSTLLAIFLALTAAVGLAACSSPSAQSNTSAKNQGAVLQVVAAENFWGSIAGQIGGAHVHIVSIITNPNTDPHGYEPTAKDAQLIAGAKLVIENGIGY